MDKQQMLLIDKQAHPSKYLKQKDRFPWPTEYTGSLLAWLTHFMEIYSYHDKKIYTPDDISHVECYSGTNDQIVACEYDARAFDINFTSNHGVVELIEGRVYRFVMKDDAVFLVLPCESHHPTRLRLVEPVTRPVTLVKGLDKLLTH